MKSDRKYLFRVCFREVRRSLMLWLFCSAVFFSVFALYELPMMAVLYPSVICLLLLAADGYFRLARSLRRHKRLSEMMGEAAKTKELPGPETLSEADDAALIAYLRKELAASDARHEERIRDMEDSYSVWVHQIKTPIAAMHLLLSQQDDANSRALRTQLRHIEQYVTMVLAFLRLHADTADYVFRMCSIDEIIRPVLRRFSSEFIGKRIRLKYEPISFSVVTDSKWMELILEQLISNAIKYTPEGGTVTVISEEPYTLCVSDTGIGIDPADLPRICEKGYTGQTGREYHRSTGLGLYLAKQICTRLHVEMKFESALSKGTRVTLLMNPYPLRPE